MNTAFSTFTSTIYGYDIDGFFCIYIFICSYIFTGTICKGNERKGIRNSLDSNNISGS